MANKRPKRKYYEIAEEEGQHLSEKTDKDGWQRGLNFSDEKINLAGLFDSVKLIRELKEKR